jgi:hypothetical protein
MINIKKETEILSKYFVSAEPNERVLELYQMAHNNSDISKMKKYERKLWSLCMFFPVLLIFIDGGFSIIDRSSRFKKRLYYFLAILEVTPEFYDKFITNKNSLSIIFSQLFFSFINIFVSLIGAVIILIFKLFISNK